jgi:tRNA uridine 5-carbamoylmethylation protein Kti12
MNQIILLCGAPSAGKLTVAKKIQERVRTNGKECFILDNHVFNDCFMTYINPAQTSKHIGAISDAAYKVRSIWLDFFAGINEFDDTVLIFTNVLLDTKKDRNSVKELKLFAKRINAGFTVIELETELKNMLDWCGNEDRRVKKKLTDCAILKEFVASTKFYTPKYAIRIQNNKDKSDKCVDEIIGAINL